MSLSDDVARLRTNLGTLGHALTDDTLAALVRVLEAGLNRIEARRCAKVGSHAPARDKTTGAIVCIYCRTPLP